MTGPAEQRSEQERLDALPKLNLGCGRLILEDFVNVDVVELAGENIRTGRHVPDHRPRPRECSMIDLCGRCLAWADASSEFAARGKGDEVFSTCPAGRPRKIARWADLAGQENPDVRFTVDGLDDVLLPVATWHGDPVCVGHLWDLTTDERNERAHGWLRR